MVDHRSGDPVLAPHRACRSTMAGADASLLARLAGARQFPANAAAEVSHRDTSLLQHDRVHSDDDRHVLPHVPAKGRRKRHLYLLAAPGTSTSDSCVLVVRKQQAVRRLLPGITDYTGS